MSKLRKYEITLIKNMIVDKIVSLRNTAQILLDSKEPPHKSIEIIKRQAEYYEELLENLD